RPEAISRAGVALVPEGRRIYADFTVEENVRLGLIGRRGRDGAERDLAWIRELFPLIEEMRERQAGALSGGRQQQLAIARGLGAVYAWIGVGIGLVFGVLRLVNFAYGQLIMIASYMLVFTQGWGDAASILIAVAAAVFASFVMERVAFRPLRTTSPATMLVA